VRTYQLFWMRGVGVSLMVPLVLLLSLELGRAVWYELARLVA
jgi:hypothetical protein